MPKDNKEKDIEKELTAPERVLPKGVEPGSPLTPELLKSINDGLEDEDIKKILGLLNKNKDSDKLKELKEHDPLFGGRTRKFFMEFSFYYETHDKDGNDTSNGLDKDTWGAVKYRELDSLLEQYNARLAVGMLHDSDVLVDKNGNPKKHEDGSIAYKEPHIHLMVEFKNAKTWTSVYRNFGLSRYNNLVIPKEPSQSYRYLFHLSEGAIAQNKTIYPFNRCHIYQAKGEKPLRISDIFTPSKSEAVDIIHKQMSVYRMQWSDVMAQDSDETEYFNRLDFEIKQKVLLGELNEKTAPAYIANVMQEQGRFASFSSFWNKNRQAEYKKADDAYVENRANYCLGFVHEKINGMVYSPLDDPDKRNLDTIYITGQGGSGKTTLGKELCRLGDYLGRGYNKVAAPGKGKTYDFADGYQGEESTLIDELTPWTMGLTEFLSIFDPHSYNKINSRNVDKIWYAHRAVITTSIGMDYFNAQMVVQDGGINKKYNRYLNDNYEPDYNNKMFTDRKFQVARRTKYIIETKPLNSDSDNEQPADYYFYALLNINSSTSVHVFVDKIYCANVKSDRSMKATAKKINNLIIEIDEGKYKPFNEIKWEDEKAVFPVHSYTYYSKDYSINKYLYEDIQYHNDAGGYPDVLPFADALKLQKEGKEYVTTKNPFEDFDNKVVNIFQDDDEKKDENGNKENPFIPKYDDENIQDSPF